VFIKTAIRAPASAVKVMPVAENSIRRLYRARFADKRYKQTACIHRLTSRPDTDLEFLEITPHCHAAATGCQGKSRASAFENTPHISLMRPTVEPALRESHGNPSSAGMSGALTVAQVSDV
jgi:hypothetical protein